MSATGNHRIILADDHALFLSGLKGLLGRYPRMEVVGEAADGQELLDMLGSTPCDVVLMDIDMPRMGGIEATERGLSLYPGLKVITLSMHGDQEFYFRMVEAGAKGFILKDSTIDEVVAAISTVAEGGTYFSQELLTSLVRNLKSTHGEYHDELSSREKEILLCICKGMSNQEIADKLFISKRTVDKHRSNILEKTGSKNTANLVVYAIKNSLVEI